MLKSNFHFIVSLVAGGRATPIFIELSSDERGFAILRVVQFNMLHEEIRILVREVAERTGEPVHRAQIDSKYVSVIFNEYESIAVVP